MVQARDLGQHAAGAQTRMEVGRSPHLGRVRGDVAGPGRDALCAISSANAAAAGSLRSNSLRSRDRWISARGKLASPYVLPTPWRIFSRELVLARPRLWLVAIDS